MPGSRRPVISVAMATRNYGRYLARALESVFRCPNPTAAPIQVVVADDASTDNTRAVLSDYRLRFSHQLEVVSIRESAGLGAAKNAALDRCLGRTVTLLDADDEFLPEKFRHCQPVMESGEVDLITNDFFHQSEEGGRVLQTRRTWSDWYFPPSTWVFRRGAVRFSPHATAAEDLEWMERRWWSLRRRHLDVPLNVQHLHGGQYCQTYDSFVPGYQLADWMFGRSHPNDALAPQVWRCCGCGTQYLLPTRCCDREAIARPLLFYLTALSPHGGKNAEFSLVMLTRNRLELTRRAVNSLLAHVPPQSWHDVELIFVDGCSTDGTLDYIRELADQFRVKLIVAHPGETFNYARACNRGARAAVGKYLMLLNNDIELRSDAPWEPLRAALEDPRVGVVGASTVWNASQRDPVWTADSPPYLIVNRPVTGDFWGTRRALYWELGGMDEGLSGYGYDELDFSYRTQLAHYLLAVARVRVHHDVHGTFDAVYGPGGREALAQENRRRFERKHKVMVHTRGARFEPHSNHELPAVSRVLAVRNEETLVRRSLARAVSDPRCRDGRVQVVVIDNGSDDQTPLALAEYRLRLPRSLTVVRLDEPVPPAAARQAGLARAVGRTVEELAPGDW
jgi:glycosyltransferase involved in cell wall biosynthesis